MTDATQSSERRVRPWIAALLTLLGWGLGLYYARRTRAAVWMAALSVAFGVALALGFLVYALTTKTFPLAFFDPNSFSAIDILQLALSFAVAIGVWGVVAKRQMVERASPVRLLGYLAIWLVPLLVSLTLAVLLRFTTIQPFHVPAGSMQPTLNAGDYVLASKWSYGYNRFSFAPFQSLFPAGRWRAHDPVRGDVVVFRPVPDPRRDFVKRIVAIAGDTVQMMDGALYINGRPVQRESLGEQTFSAGGETFTAHAFRETLPNGVSYTTLDRGPTELDNTPLITVPPEHVFVLGDDRDNSADSRVPSVVGAVPYDHLVGRVDQIFAPR